MHRAGIKMLSVTYRGGSPSMAATIAGETQALFAGASAAGQFKAGTLRGLAVSGKRALAAVPRPADHRRILSRLRGRYLARPVRAGRHAGTGRRQAAPDRCRDLLKRPDVAEKLNVSGSLEPLVLSAADFSALIHKDYDKFGKPGEGLRHQGQIAVIGDLFEPAAYRPNVSPMKLPGPDHPITIARNAKRVRITFARRGRLPTPRARSRCARRAIGRCNISRAPTSP